MGIPVRVGFCANEKAIKITLDNWMPYTGKHKQVSGYCDLGPVKTWVTHLVQDMGNTWLHSTIPCLLVLSK